MLSSLPPSTSITGGRGIAWTPEIVAHDGCTKGASNMCGTDKPPRANEPWMGWISPWEPPLHSPNNNGRPWRGSSKHPDMTPVEVLGGKHPLCACSVCPSYCSGRGPQTATCAGRGFVLVQLVSSAMACRTSRPELCLDIPAWMRRRELAAHPAYDGFEDTLVQSKRHFLLGFFCGKDAPVGDGFDLPEGRARMGGAGRHTIPSKLLFRQWLMHGCAM